MAEPAGAVPAAAMAAGVVSTAAAASLEQASITWLGVPIAQVLWALAGATLVLAFVAPMKPVRAVGAVLLCTLIGIGAPVLAVKFASVLAGSERWLSLICAGGAQVMVPIATSRGGEIWDAIMARLRGRA